jgi:tetratricopeptide (TPR) repeat protein
LKGDEEGALAIARQLPAADDALLRGLLFDQRAWSELAARQRDVLATDPDNIEALGFAAAYNRLSGNTAEFDKHINSIRAYAEKRFGGNSVEYCREALFLNGFTREAVQLLSREDAADAFKVQIMRSQYADAFDAAGIGTARQSRETWLRGVLENPDGSKKWQNNFRIAAQLGKVLATVGEKHEAVEVFAQLASAIKKNRDGIQLRELAEAELQAKLIADAFEHAAQAFDKDRNAASITLLFVSHRTAAKTWWDIYTELEPTETTRRRLDRVRGLFYQRNEHKEVIEQVSEAHAQVEALDSKHARRTKWLHAIGETYLLHQENEMARQCFESIADQHSPAAIRLADMLAKQEEWIAASHWYDAAWRRDRQPYTLYLYGEMLSKSGAEDAGDESKQLARLIPLAGASRYDGLASHLARRGLSDAAQRECELLRRCSTWSELQMFHAIASLSQAAELEEPLRAAAYSEQRMLNCLQETWHFTDQTSYVRIPLEVHQARAKGLLEQGKIDEAIAELRMCQQIWPGELNLPEVFVPQLDELGKTEAANEAFNRAYELIDEACEIFPNSALHHNNAAWLAARCNRRLDDALAHVNRAIELAPNQAQYIDTLGEVCFQQGKIDLAIDCAKQCIDLEPNTAFYQEQLTRFQAAQGQPE